MNRDEFLKYWFEAEKENLKLINFAKELKSRNIKVIILSNNFKERTEYYDKNFPFIRDIIDKVYYSWQTGFVKPDKRAFELIFKDNNLNAKDCIYFDDSQDNINLAKSLGIKSYIYKNLKDLKQKIYS